MAQPRGSLKWSTLARMTDREVYDYFRGAPLHHEPDHAFNALRMVRAKMHKDGTRREFPLGRADAGASIDSTVKQARLNERAGKPRYEEYPPAPKHETPAPAPMPKPEEIPAPDFREEREAPAPAPVRETREEPKPEEPTPFIMPDAANGLGPLAALLMPHMAQALAPAIAQAVKAMYETLAANQVTQVAVIKPGTPPIKLSGMHHNKTAKVISLVSEGANVMLVGPAGCGKTILAKSVAQAFERKLTIVSCSAGMSESQLLGRLLPLGESGSFRYVESPFMRAYREGGVILLDEMDGADGNLLLAINAALANGQVDVEARLASGLEPTVERHPECIIIAACNTWGNGADMQYIGRNALDVSSLDRFYRLAIDYDEALERAIGEPEIVAYVQVLRRKTREAKIRRIVSTRCITRLMQAVRAGIPLAEAKADELASWTADERTKVGERA